MISYAKKSHTGSFFFFKTTVFLKKAKNRQNLTNFDRVFMIVFTNRKRITLLVKKR